jgi:polyhydroxyalkanoate synthesis regulator protein
MTMAEQPAAHPVLIKRYAGRRFYDTGLGRYVSVEDVTELARGRQTVIVRDADTGVDITSAVLNKLAAGGV